MTIKTQEKRKEFDNSEIFVASPSVDQKILLYMVNEMYQKSFFSVCVFMKISEIFCIQYTRNDLYQRLNQLHCMDRSKMDEELFEFVVSATKELIKTGVVGIKHKKPVFTANDFI